MSTESRLVGLADLDALTLLAVNSPRRRAHRNLHDSHQEPCQRLLNAVEPDSYIPPHRHSDDSGRETLLALRGRFVLIHLTDAGAIRTASVFGLQACPAIVCEISPRDWHTVVSLETGSVLFETKGGPFDPAKAKTLAPFAPGEGGPEAPAYLEWLRSAGLRAAGTPLV